jgi:CubicO group peptidase (beta-lactamase class C family)
MKNIIAIFVFTIIKIAAFCQQSHSEKLNELITFYQKENLFNGSVLVARKGEILLSKGYGIQNAALNKINNSNSIFSIYSITKTFTATVILKLIEENKLALSDKLSRFYPDYPKGDSITIENLLNHTAGVYDFTRGNNMPDQTEKSFIAFQKNKPLDFTAGTAWSYSNSNYYFLGYIIEKLTGMSYEQAVATFIFEPLQMKHSGFAFKHLKNINKAIGYGLFTEKIKKPAEVYDPPGPYAAGGIYSTVEDLYKYYNGLKSYKILAKETLEKAYTAHKGNYGYGWVVLDMFDKKTVGHSGAGAGFRSNFIQIPEDDICITLLTNTERDLNNITRGILKILYDKPYKIPIPIKANNAVLQQYTGTYEVNPEFIIYTYIENNKLIAQPSRQPKGVLYPEKPNLFYVEEMSGYIRFAKNKNQIIDTLIFTKEGKDTKAKKIYPSWGIVGSATENGWDGPDQKLTETTTKGIWKINGIALKKGELKFRLNNDWTINLGRFNDKKLMHEGSNLQVENGVFNISLDLRDNDNPKYTIEKLK